MAYIHITPNRLQKAGGGEEEEELRAYFNHMNNRIIERKVYGDNQEEVYIKIEGHKYPIEKKGGELYWW